MLAEQKPWSHVENNPTSKRRRYRSPFPDAPNLIATGLPCNLNRKDVRAGTPGRTSG